jgi:hypothetical protein
MKLSERIKSLFRRRPLTEEELAARAKEIQEYDFVRLRRDLPQVGLAQGTVGTVLLVYGDGAAFEVEVVGPEGETLFLETLSADDLERVD